MVDRPHWLFLTWQTRLLPYVEQPALWAQAQSAYATSFHFWQPPHVLQTPVALYACAADPRTLAVATTDGGIRVTLTEYLGVEGTDQFSRDGLLFAKSRVRFADVTDGLSNTLLVGERPPRGDVQFGWWYNGHGQDVNGSAGSLLGVREVNAGALGNSQCFGGPYNFGPGRVEDPCAAYHFWSLHSGGAHFLSGDGSVRFLSHAIDPILPALATRGGGETVALPE